MKCYTPRHLFFGTAELRDHNDPRLLHWGHDCPSCGRRALWGVTYNRISHDEHQEVWYECQWCGEEYYIKHSKPGHRDGSYIRLP